MMLWGRMLFTLIHLFVLVHVVHRHQLAAANISSEGHVFMQSDKAPVTEVFEQAGEAKIFAELCEHFEFVDQEASCRILNENWVEGALDFAKTHGWNVNDEYCRRAATHNESETEYLRQKMNELERIGEALVGEIAESTVGNWSDPYFTIWYERSMDEEVCNVSTLTSVRIGKNWYVTIPITNAPWNEYLGSGQRQYVNEHLRAAGNPPGFFPPAKMKLRIKDENGNQNFSENATTSISIWQGAGDHPTFYDETTEEIPALELALKHGEIAVDQARDTILPSNSAILIAPLLLNLVPVAFLSSVGSCQMLLYILFTDILTALPLGIKGVEVLISADFVHRSAFTWILGSNNGSTDALAETWVAECHMTHEFHNIGVAFIAVAVLAIVLGIALEFLAHRYVQRRTKRINKQLSEEQEYAERISQEEVRREGGCQKCNCHRVIAPAPDFEEPWEKDIDPDENIYPNDELRINLLKRVFVRRWGKDRNTNS